VLAGAVVHRCRLAGRPRLGGRAVNPDAGPAVADITLLGLTFSTGRLRGILIPGHKTITVDLGTVVPRRTRSPPTSSSREAVSRWTSSTP
jgi:hypothetical protein